MNKDLSNNPPFMFLPESILKSRRLPEPLFHLAYQFAQINICLFGVAGLSALIFLGYQGIFDPIHQHVAGGVARSLFMNLGLMLLFATFYCGFIAAILYLLRWIKKRQYEQFCYESGNVDNDRIFRQHSKFVAWFERLTIAGFLFVEVIQVAVFLFISQESESICALRFIFAGHLRFVVSGVSLLGVIILSIGYCAVIRRAERQLAREAGREQNLVAVGNGGESCPK